jgi:acyl-CoA synthetase (NDP forming)
MVSDDRVWRALAAQSGVALVSSQDDLLGVLDFVDLHRGRPAPDCTDVLLVGPSGGAGVLAADCVDAAGLTLSEVPTATHPALRALGLGAGTSLANPLEVTVGPRARADLVCDVVSTVLAATTCPDVIVHANAQSFVTFGSDLTPLLAYVQAVAELQAVQAARITLVLRNTECAPQSIEDEARAVARAAGVPLYRTFSAAATAITAGKRLTTAGRTAGSQLSRMGPLRRGGPLA